MLWFGEMQDKSRFVRVVGGEDFCKFILDGDVFLPSGVCGKDVANQSFEVCSGDGVLKDLELGPIGFFAKNGLHGGEFLLGKRGGCWRFAENQKNRQHSQKEQSNDRGGVAHTCEINSKF